MKFNTLQAIEESLKSLSTNKFIIEFYKDGDLSCPTQTFHFGRVQSAYFLANNLQNNYTASISDDMIVCKARKPKKHIYYIKRGA